MNIFMCTNLLEVTSLCLLVGLSAKWRTSDLDVTCLRPPAATRHIHVRYVLLVNSAVKFNLLSWLLIYL